jgi:hypothetical protein
VRVRGDDHNEYRDEYWALREDHDEVPVADLSDERKRPRAPGPRSRRWAAVVLVVALGAAGVVVAAHASNDNGARRRVATGTHRKVATIDDGQARGDVLSALSTTTASGSFHIRYSLTSAAGTAPATTTTNAGGPCITVVIGGGMSIDRSSPVGKATVDCGYPVTVDPQNVTISGEGVVHLDPTAMVSTANVSGLGEITTRVDGTNVWEDGGGNYGLAPSTKTGPGAPLSQFAGLVMGTLGRREGAIAMSSLASPSGYLDMAKEAIGDASAHGNAVVDGVQVIVYDVTLDTMKSLDRPGLTPEEIATTQAALAVLRSEGYEKTSVQLSVDALGFIRRAQTVIAFSDGGTVSADTTFSDFGCSSVEMLPNGPSIVPDPTGCAKGVVPVPSTTSTAATVPTEATATTAAPVAPTSVYSTTTSSEAPVAATTSVP